MVDEFLAEDAGSRAAFLSQLGMNAKAVAVVAATIASYLPFPVVGQAGDLALYALGEQSGAEYAASVAIGLIPGGKLAALMGRIGSSAWRGAVHYAGRYGGAIIRGAGRATLGLADRAMGYLRRGCGCFTEGTPVLTATGPVPVERIREGDLVLAQDEATGELSFRRVLRTFVRHEAPIVEVLVRDERGGGGVAVLETTEEHPFWIEGAGWVQAGSLGGGMTA